MNKTTTKKNKTPKKPMRALHFTAVPVSKAQVCVPIAHSKKKKPRGGVMYTQDYFQLDF